MGFSAVSFYLMWGLLEGEPGVFRAEGVLAIEEFFNAAQQAGLYLVARPGPYINAEVSGGGFPGWLQRTTAQLRSTDAGYADAAKHYVTEAAKLIVDAQITNGGPVILVQPENEYTLCKAGGPLIPTFATNGPGAAIACLEPEYMALIEQAYRDAGIVVPLISNDGVPFGNWRPDSGLGSADIYGYDFYPVGWSTDPPCSQDWAAHGPIPLNDAYVLIGKLNYTTSPHEIVEFQGGAPDAWGGVGLDECAAMIGPEFQRVFYKKNYALHTTYMNLYMIYGGTNWGNMGHPLGYTSYDGGAAIKEDRTITREKFSEVKLQANFLRVSPAFLTAKPLPDSSTVYTTNSTLTTTPVQGEKTTFYILRHTDYFSTNNTEYQFRVSTSLGDIVIPQLGGQLAINGRDSKIHVTDYDVGDINLLYSTAEILSWQETPSKTILLLYGAEGETHEFAFPLSVGQLGSAEGVAYRQIGDSHVVQWTVGRDRKILRFGSTLEVHLLWRNDAYNYWILDLPAGDHLGLKTSAARLNPQNNASYVIVKAGYLLREASIEGSTLRLTGDINATTTFEIVSAPEGRYDLLVFNNAHYQLEECETTGLLAADVPFISPEITIPNLESQNWWYKDSLPEMQSAYDDDQWTACTHTASNNPKNLSTPTSLYASDYGYHGGSLIYRGQFTANGQENELSVHTQGGLAFGHSIWLNSTFLGSWPGNATAQDYNHSLVIGGKVQQGEKYIITVVIDHMGLDANFLADADAMKAPRGILDYSLAGHDQKDVVWKLTGNFGGEQYYDKSRGPLNEGATYTERYGLHLPGAPMTEWTQGSPMKGISEAGIGLFATTFDLNLSEGYDVPLSIQIDTDGFPSNTTNFRAQIFVNGFQFGKYVSNIGPQFKFPIPEGIMNHHGENYLAITLWALDGNGARFTKVSLSYETVVQSAYKKPELVSASKYQPRENIY